MIKFGGSQFKVAARLRFLPSGYVVEHRVSGFGGSSLVEDIESLQGFEFLFLVDLMPTEERIGGGGLKRFPLKTKTPTTD